MTMHFSYVLPDPASYSDWRRFDDDLAAMRCAGYEAVELQIADPMRFDDVRVRHSLDAVGYRLCAIQTGGTYATLGNCLATSNDSIRHPTTDLFRRFIDLAAPWPAVLVFGLLQGRLADEPDRAAGRRRIEEALADLGRYAEKLGVTIAVEPVCPALAGFFNTVDDVAALVRRLDLPNVRLMIDSQQMSLAEPLLPVPLGPIRDILTHVHLSETNHDILGTGHWDTGGFLRDLTQIGYNGLCSIGVYRTQSSRAEAMSRCMDVIRRQIVAGG
jgi:D-psicose/D-tagatose/L-ribulose 3-epimerase